jgi:molecular chaperone GrpE
MTAKKKPKTEEEIEYLEVPPSPDDEEAGVDVPVPAEEPRDKDHPEPHSETAKSLRAKLKKKEGEVRLLHDEIGDLKDQLLRKLAEMENLRKRFEREKSEFQQFAVSDIMTELLEVQDNFERALRSPDGEENGKTFRDGVELIFRMFQSLLARRGVEPIPVEDKTFDPNLHHAMSMEESEDVEEPKVVEELQRGYTLRGRLLRPTLVKVAVPKKQ